MRAHSPERKTYWKTAAALLALLVATIGAAFFNLGPLNTPVAMGIALLKAALIVLIFMHVRYHRPLLWVFAGAGFFWLGIMFALALGDYLSRGW